MAVNVDVCGQGMACHAARCPNPARFYVRRGDLPRLTYCGYDTRQRLIFYRRQHRQIVITDQAKRLLDGVTL